MTYLYYLYFLYLGCVLLGLVAGLYFAYVEYRAKRRYMAYKMKLLLNHDYETFNQVCEMEMREAIKESGIEE